MCRVETENIFSLPLSKQIVIRRKVHVAVIDDGPRVVGCVGHPDPRVPAEPLLDARPAAVHRPLVGLVVVAVMLGQLLVVLLLLALLLAVLLGAARALRELRPPGVLQIVVEVLRLHPHVVQPLGVLVQDVLPHKLGAL